MLRRKEESVFLQFIKIVKKNYNGNVKKDIIGLLVQLLSDEDHGVHNVFVKEKADLFLDEFMRKDRFNYFFTFSKILVCGNVHFLFSFSVYNHDPHSWTGYT